VLLVDTNVVLDVVEDDSGWYSWSADQLHRQSRAHELLINPVIYAELSCFYASPQMLDFTLEDLELRFHEIPKMGLYFAGVAHRHYRRAGGPRDSILPDFLIGAHAAALGCGILTRDSRRFRNYFPRVPLVTPS
jgi:predicted nucleic acid-binding protein